jgi:hypothetical protein
MESCEFHIAYNHLFISSDIGGTRNMSTPWGKLQTAPVMPCSLQDVMSEQLAHDLQQKEEEERFLNYPSFNMFKE